MEAYYILIVGVLFLLAVSDLIVGVSNDAVNFLNSAAAKLIFEYRIFKEDQLICTGETTQVFTTLNSELVLVNPPFFEEWKRKNRLL